MPTIQTLKSWATGPGISTVLFPVTGHTIVVEKKNAVISYLSLFSTGSQFPSSIQSQSPEASRILISIFLLAKFPVTHAWGEVHSC